jgi:hypothetical protein
MWFKIIPYSCKNGRVKKMDLNSVLRYLTATSRTKAKQSSEWFSHNIRPEPLDADAAEEWIRKITANLITPKRGRKMTRYAYQLIINLGTPQELKDEFREVIRKFMEEEFMFGRGYVFIHTDTGNVHAHILLHPVQMDGRAVRFNRMTINHYRYQIEKYAKPLEDIKERMLELKKKRAVDTAESASKPSGKRIRKAGGRNDIKKLVQRLRSNRSLPVSGG